MVKYKSRVTNTLKSVPKKNTKDMASKALNKKSPETKPAMAKPLVEEKKESAPKPNPPKANPPKPKGGDLKSTAKKAAPIVKAVAKKAAPIIKAVAKKAAPLIKKVAPKVKRIIQDRYGAVLPFGGKLPEAPQVLSDSTIDQLDPHVYIHMLGAMDMPTFHMLQGIAANYLNIEHPMRRITNQALGGDFTFPKHLSRIAMKDVMKATSPQHLSQGLHGEWMDMMDGRLSPEEVGGGLFSSLKTLVKKGVKGSRKALRALGEGAKGAIRAVSQGAMGAQMIGKSVSNALMQGLDIANALSPVIQTVFPSTSGVLKAGVGHANAAKELVDRGINVSSRVEKALQPAVDVFGGALGDLNDPIVMPFNKPVGAGLDMSNVRDDGAEDTGERFTS